MARPLAENEALGVALRSVVDSFERVAEPVLSAQTTVVDSPRPESAAIKTDVVEARAVDAGAKDVRVAVDAGEKVVQAADAKPLPESAVIKTDVVETLAVDAGAKGVRVAIDVGEKVVQVADAKPLPESAVIKTDVADVRAVDGGAKDPRVAIDVGEKVVQVVDAKPRLENVVVRTNVVDDGDDADMAKVIVDSSMVAPIAMPQVEAQMMTTAAVTPTVAVEAASAAAPLSPTAMLVEAATAVADTLLVSPALFRGEGDIRVQLRPDVLDGSDVVISVQGRTLSVAFEPSSSDMTVFLTQHIADFQMRLAERVQSFDISAVVHPAVTRGTRVARKLGEQPA